MKKKLLKMSRRKVCKENVFKKTKKNRKKFMLWEEGEAETLIKDKRLCLSPFFCVPQQLLHHFFPPTPTPPPFFFSFTAVASTFPHSLFSACSMGECHTAPSQGTHTHKHTQPTRLHLQLLHFWAQIYTNMLNHVLTQKRTHKYCAAKFPAGQRQGVQDFKMT